MALNDGPVGLVLLGAMYAWVVPGLLLILSGIALVPASGGATYANWVLAMGIAMSGVGMLRGLPCIVEVSRYQAERANQGRLPSPPPPPTSPPCGPDS